ncbi:zinc finger, A20 domain-containing 3, isoform CRA_d, partial [Chytridium lagenaria]
KLLFSTSFKCRCTRTFCSIHRYSDRHSCSYNYREAAKSELIKDNPKVIAKKVHEI